MRVSLYIHLDGTTQRASAFLSIIIGLCVSDSVWLANRRHSSTPRLCVRDPHQPAVRAVPSGLLVPARHQRRLSSVPAEPPSRVPSLSRVGAGGTPGSLFGSPLCALCFPTFRHLLRRSETSPLGSGTCLRVFLILASPVTNSFVGYPNRLFSF